MTRAASQAPHTHTCCLSCSLALSSLNKHTEAVAYYRKALELDPDNETYKSNLKVAELRLREAPSPVSPLGTSHGDRVVGQTLLRRGVEGWACPVWEEGRGGGQHVFNGVFLYGKKFIFTDPQEEEGACPGKPSGSWGTEPVVWIPQKEQAGGRVRSGFASLNDPWALGQGLPGVMRAGTGP